MAKCLWHSIPWLLGVTISPHPQVVPGIASELLLPSYISEVKPNFSKRNSSLNMEDLTTILATISTEDMQRAMVEMPV